MAGSLFRPSATSSRLFEAVALSLKLVPREVRNDINRTTRATLNPEWRESVSYYATSNMDKKVLAKGARIKPGNPVTLVAATSKKALSGGLIPDSVTARSFEFGTESRDEETGYTRRNRGGSGTHEVRRRTKRQIPRKNSGRVVYRAAGEMLPRLTSLWVQIIVRKIYEAHKED